MESLGTELTIVNLVLRRHFDLESFQKSETEFENINLMWSLKIAEMANLAIFDDLPLKHTMT